MRDSSYSNLNVDHNDDLFLSFGEPSKKKKWINRSSQDGVVGKLVSIYVGDRTGIVEVILEFSFVI